MRRLARATLARPGADFEVYLRAISARGGTVLTERIDVLSFGRVRIQFWVCGRFDVEGEKIVGWRDYFDWLAFTRATARGLLGALLPNAAREAAGPWPPRRQPPLIPGGPLGSGSPCDNARDGGRAAT